MAAAAAKPKAEEPGVLSGQTRAYEAVRRGTLTKADAEVIAAALDIYASVAACATVQNVIGDGEFTAAMDLLRGFKAARE